MQSIEFIRLQC